MRTQNIRTQAKVGLGLFALFLVLAHFTPAPHLLLGLLVGAALCCIITGTLPDSAYARLKAFKKKLLGRT